MENFDVQQLFRVLSSGGVERRPFVKSTDQRISEAWAMIGHFVWWSFDSLCVRLCVANLKKLIDPVVLYSRGLLQP